MCTEKREIHLKNKKPLATFVVRCEALIPWQPKAKRRRQQQQIFENNKMNIHGQTKLQR
jgi:hypothetical protein